MDSYGIGVGGCEAAKSEAWPDVDIVIPTLNCAKSLERTLRSIRQQEYPGNLKVIVVDGASEDETVKVARSFGCDIYILEQRYMNGLNGTYNIGMSRGRSPLIMKIDSDNVLVGRRMVYDLVTPFRDESVTFAEPFTAVDPASSLLVQYGAVMELWKLMSVVKGMTKCGRYFVSSDLSYGLVNCAVFRRSAYDLLGGFVSDTTFLYELKRKGINVGALVPSSKYYHYFSDSSVEIFKKWHRRIPKISRAISDRQFATSGKRIHITSGISNTRIFLRTLCYYIGTRKRIYLTGIFYFMSIFFALLLHPISFLTISSSLKEGYD